MPNQLTSEEKRFVACFLMNTHQKTKPKLSRSISLYTYLDGTCETRAEQLRQICSQDRELISWLNLIRGEPKSRSVAAFVRGELKRNGYLSSPTFASNFERVRTWLVEGTDVQKYCSAARAGLVKTKPVESLPNGPASSADTRSFSGSEEDMFIETVYNSINASPPRLGLPRKSFSQEFRSETTFYAAATILNMKLKPSLVVPDASYYQTIKFNGREAKAIQRWLSKYKALGERINMAEAKKWQAELLEQEESQRRKEAWDRHAAEVLARSRINHNHQGGSASAYLEETWGRVPRPRLTGSGNDWREQN